MNPNDLPSIRRYAARTMQSALPDAPTVPGRPARTSSPRAALAIAVRAAATALEWAADRIHPDGPRRPAASGP